MSVLAKRILAELEGGRDRRAIVPHLPPPARALLLAALTDQKRLPVLIARDQADAEAVYRDLAFLFGTDEDEAPSKGLLFLGADEKSPYEEYSPDPRSVMERIATLYRLSKERSALRAVVVTPRAFVRRHVPPSFFERGGQYVVTGETIDRDALLKGLVDWGYNSVTTVEDPGTFSVRGGILDVYSPYLPRPVRIDLFGDEIESIRIFDPTTQRTTEDLDDAILLPAREVIFSNRKEARSEPSLSFGPPQAEGGIAEAWKTVQVLGEETNIPTRKVRAVLDDIENHIHFFGIEALLPLFHPGGLAELDVYLPKGDEVVYLTSDAEALDDFFAQASADALAGYQVARASHQLALAPERHMAEGSAVLRRVLAGARRIELPDMVVGEPGAPVLPLETEGTESIRTEMIKSTREHKEGADLLHPITHRLKRWRAAGMSTLLVCRSRGQAERIKSLLSPKGVQVRVRTKPVSWEELSGAEKGTTVGTLRDPSVHAWLVLGEVSGGFVMPAARLAVISEEEIFGQRTKQSRRKVPAAHALDLADLKAGDFVVHIDHGIGLYHGLTRLAVNGVDQDFLLLEYKGGDKLYLPIHRLRLVQKYASAEEGRSPQLSRLGTTTWIGTKKKVKDTLLKMAAELLRLYAMRAAVEGQAFPPPDEEFTEFEAEFAFEPTPDQQRAIDDVIGDLQKPHPMDRLICGDVGYGKTEVAMRAAMLAVRAGKQVAVLVPTTVLAAQHFNVFSDRFEGHGASIGIVSRFQTNEAIKETLKKVTAGQVDIVIGTHRLLSQDVKFKDLGLLIVDEEHRFGVSHKEKLKKYRAKVHVLTMSATPIPRTMHMGMMGVRDMSVIETPPVDRLAVKTEVHKFSEDVIREAIVQEIRRGGQCFVVHNRVASIGAFARFLEKLVPEARVIVGHGQMEEDQLEKVMVDFMSKQYNVLLSTTIIESGIDIANANTMIINRADRMGLAQLYQLRGRVGRSKVRGYAVFLIPAGNLTKEARKRIAVLQRFTELGAGFKVATHDLEIRGAGNLLGKEQSGTISAVGFEMYQALLKEAIEELKGAVPRALREPEIQVPVTALIPDKYVPHPGERLNFYQRMNRADTDEATYDILQEIADLYGTPPAEVESFGLLMLVKQRLARIGAVALDFGALTKTMPPRIVLRFDPDLPMIAPEVLVEYVQKRPQARKVTPDGKLMVYLAPFEEPREILQQSKDQLDEILKLRR